MKEMKVEILEERICDDFVEVVDLRNAATDLLELTGLHVEFDLKAENDQGEVKQFTIVFQSLERNDGIEAYNGHEMTTAAKYGCDADESQEFELFMGYADGIFDTLDARANAISKAMLEQFSSSECRNASN